MKDDGYIRILAEIGLCKNSSVMLKMCYVAPRLCSVKYTSLVAPPTFFNLNTIYLGGTLKVMTLGTDNFKALRTGSMKLVDKSLFIKDIIDSWEVATLITAPRRWGKTVNLDMLRVFLENKDSEIFCGGNVTNGDGAVKQLSALKICTVDSGEYKKYMGLHSVLFVSLKDVSGYSSKEVMDNLKNVLSDLFRGYSYLYDSLQSSKDVGHINDCAKFSRILNKEASPAELTESLKFLSKLLFDHSGKMVYVLVDEYDKPLSNLFDSLSERGWDEQIEQEIKEVAYRFTSMLAACGKGNGGFVKKMIMTGVLDTLQRDGNSGFNNVKIHSVLTSQTYGNGFGFSEKEVSDLVDYYGETKACVEQNKDEIKSVIKAWYNGYTISSNDGYGSKKLLVYVPWAVMSYLQDAIKCNFEGRGYWVESGKSSILESVLSHDWVNKNSEIGKQILGRFSLLVDGQAQYFDIEGFRLIEHLSSKDQDVEKIFAYLLFHCGYITGSNQVGYYAIPNMEVKKEFSNVVISKLKGIPNNGDNEVYINGLAQIKSTFFYRDYAELVQKFISGGVDLAKLGDQIREVGCRNIDAQFTLLEIAAISGDVSRMLDSFKYCADLPNDKGYEGLALGDFLQMSGTNITEVKHSLQQGGKKWEQAYIKSLEPNMELLNFFDQMRCYIADSFLMKYFTSPIVFGSAELISGAVVFYLTKVGLSKAFSAGLFVAWTSLMATVLPIFFSIEGCDLVNVKSSNPDDLTSLKHFEKYILENKDKDLYVSVNELCKSGYEKVTNITIDLFPTKIEHYPIDFHLCNHVQDEVKLIGGNDEL